LTPSRSTPRRSSCHTTTTPATACLSLSERRFPLVGSGTTCRTTFTSRICPLLLALTMQLRPAPPSPSIVTTRERFRTPRLERVTAQARSTCPRERIHLCCKMSTTHCACRLTARRSACFDACRPTQRRRRSTCAQTTIAARVQNQAATDAPAPPFPRPGPMVITRTELKSIWGHCLCLRCGEQRRCLCRPGNGQT
jgi:hypothetical protein